MPRIRTIKPEFWSDEKLSVLDPTTRLVFLALVSLADDAGRVIDNIKQLDGLVFSNRDESCRDALGVLHAIGRIHRYRSSGGQSVIELVHWTRHQKVDRPSAYVLPAMPLEQTGELAHDAPSRETRETVASVSRDTRAPTVDLGPGTLDRRPAIVDRTPVAQSLDDPVTALTAAFDFGPCAGAVAELCRAAPNPRGVAAVLRMYLTAESDERRTPVEVGVACRDYAANGAPFNAAFFAGYLRRTRRMGQRAAGRRRNEHEAHAIAAEQQQSVSAAREAAEADRVVEAFKNSNPDRYAGMLARAEGEVPSSITLGREIIVRAQVLQLIRSGGDRAPPSRQCVVMATTPHGKNPA